jgi:outer membrane protein OmpA-like peptidoglycan-associated protein
MRPAGVAIPVTLNAGQTYTLVGSDVTGTLVEADKRVAVLSGHACAALPDGESCNHLTEMLPPATSWGKKFIVTKLILRSGQTEGDYVRIVAHEDATTVSVPGQSDINLDAGQSWFGDIMNGSRGTVVTSNKPIMLVQFTNGGEVEGADESFVGATEMTVVAPEEQLLNEYLVATPGASFQVNLLSLGILSTDLASLRLNGEPVDVASAVTFGNFSALRLEINPGSHALTAAGVFSVISYGADADIAYALPAGFAVKDLTQPEPDESPSDDASPSPSDSATADPSESPSDSASPSGSASPSDSASASASGSPEVDPSESESPTSSPTPTASESASSSPPTDTGPGGGGGGGGAGGGDAPSESPTPTIAAASATPSLTVSPTSSVSPVPSESLSAAPVVTPVRTLSATPTVKVSASSPKTTTKVATAKASPKSTAKVAPAKKTPTPTAITVKTVTISGFSPASTSLTAAQVASITKTAKALKPGSTVTCVGYSSTGGTAAALRTVGLSRAQAVCSQFAKVAAVRTSVLYGGALAATSPAQEAANRKVIVRFG